MMILLNASNTASIVCGVTKSKKSKLFIYHRDGYITLYRDLDLIKLEK